MSIVNQNISEIALYLGKDKLLAEQVGVVIANKYKLEFSSDLPLKWDTKIEAVLIEFDGDADTTLAFIAEILSMSNGVNINILLKKKDVDFLIKASHYGVQGFIDCPDEVPQILSIMHMQTRRKVGKSGMVSSFFSLKGGVGVTSIATNTASHIQDITKQKTVVLDLNVPLGDTTLYLNMENKSLYTVVDYILNIDRFDDALVYNSLDQHESGLYVLALPSDLTELDNLTGSAIKNLIASLTKFFNHVIIDCASNLSEINLSCLDMSDNIVVVSEPSLSSLRAASKALDVCQRLGYDKESLMLLVNRNQSDTKDAIKELIDYVGDGFDKISYVNNAYFLFSESMLQSKLIKEIKSDSLANKQILSVANKLQYGVEEKPAEEVAPQQNTSQSKLDIFVRNLLNHKIIKKIIKR